MTGHLLGAAGGIEFILLALAHQEGKLPPTVNYVTPDPECDLDYVPNTKREVAVEDPHVPDEGRCRLLAVGRRRARNNFV